MLTRVITTVEISETKGSQPSNLPAQSQEVFLGIGGWLVRKRVCSPHSASVCPSLFPRTGLPGFPRVTRTENLFSEVAFKALRTGLTHGLDLFGLHRLGFVLLFQENLIQLPVFKTPEIPNTDSAFWPPSSWEAAPF